MKDSNRIYKVKDIQCDLDLEWNIDISYKRVWRGKHIALNMSNISRDDLFSQLPYYCHNLKLANKGSITHILIDEQGQFEMLFVGFGFTIRSFLRYLRPLIIIDATHFKGSYKGTNLVAVGIDGNNQILPISMGVTQGKKIRGIFWKTCKAYTTHEFDSLLTVLRGYRPDDGQKLKIAAAEALLDEERSRNGRIYHDWYDLEAQETPRNRRTNVNSCPTQIVHVPFTENAMGISEWAGTAEWRKYSYITMNNWTAQHEDSTNNNYDPSQPSTSHGYMFHQLKEVMVGMLNSMLNDKTEAPSTAKSHPQRSTMSPTENVPDKTTEDRVCEMWKGDGSTSLSGCGISKT
nr:transposase, MuDR, MULE transposase domain protein [Tanacetum cinerariifolium]